MMEFAVAIGPKWRYRTTRAPLGSAPFRLSRISISRAVHQERGFTMRLNRMLRQGLAIVAALSMVTVWPAAPVLAADVNINLDGNATNGNESNCALNVVNTSPTAIKNKVTNKAVGQAFRFSWAF